MSTRSSSCLAFAVGLMVTLGCSETPTEPVATPNGPLGTGSATSIGPAFAAAANTWIARQNMPRGRVRHATAALTNPAGHSIVYSIGGVTSSGGISNTVQAYDVDANTWSTVAPLPDRVYRTNGAGVIGGKVYVSGGLTIRRIPLTTLYAYDPATNVWTRKSSMPFQTFQGVTGVINNRLYVLTSCGAGADCDAALPVAFYRYDPATDSWTTLPSPPVAHEDAVAGFIGGKFYVAGGQNEGGLRLDVYDPGTNHWSAGAPLPRARRAAAGVALGAKLYLIGGLARNADGTESLVGTTSVYDPATDRWTHVAPLPAPSANYSASRVVRAGSARIEVVGGTGSGNNLEYTP